jgi:hypothetical protein
VIDNHVISNELEQYYVPGFVKIRTDVLTIIPDYITAHNTMDHYPIFSQYNLEGSVTSVPNISAIQLGIITFPNPFNEELNIKATKTLTEVQLKLMNVEGQILNAQHYDTIASGSTIRPVLPT